MQSRWRVVAGMDGGGAHLLYYGVCNRPQNRFQRFKAMRTVFMPQSIVETGAAVFFGLTSREEGLKAVEEWAAEPPE